MRSSNSEGMDPSRLALFLSCLVIASHVARSELVISNVDRRIDLTSHIVRTLSTFQVENLGPDVVSEVLLAFSDNEARSLANIKPLYKDEITEDKGSIITLPIAHVQPEGMPTEFTFYSVSLPKGLEKGESLALAIFAIFTHCLKPFPEEITQTDVQLVLYQDNAFYFSPYSTKAQTLSIRLPNGRIESYTSYADTKQEGSEIRYGPFENIPPFSYSPVAVHFEHNDPFAVAEKLVREIEISHWGNVKVTEHYHLVHGGARHKGGFSRFDYQRRPSESGVSSFTNLVARLPSRAHSLYYKDEIGNISTSHLRSDSLETKLQIQPRFPLFGGWRTSFTIGYSLPLEDFLYKSEGKNLLNITFGCPFAEVTIDDLLVKVVLPEGSDEISVSIPFPAKQWQERKYSHLDIVGMPVVVLEKNNVVPEHNLHFQVYYKFNNLSLLMEPMILVSGFFFVFIAYLAYMNADMSISKSSTSYLAKLQWNEVQSTIQQVCNIICRCLAVHDKLDASLQDLSRTGNIQSYKLARKNADGQLKELAKDLKPVLPFLQSSSHSAQIWPKVEELISKEREMQDRSTLKHSTAADCFEKRYSSREIDSRIAPHQQKLAALRQEIDELLEVIDDM